MSKHANLSVWPVAQENSARQRKGRYLPEAMAHPGKMLPAIARHAIEAYTEPGDLVVDPMCGIGTTLVEAVHLGRNGFGVELENRWADLANANVQLATDQGATGNAKAVCGDGRAVGTLAATGTAQKASLVITSPPYGTSLHGQVRTSAEPVQRYDHKYSDNRFNLGNASTNTLLDAFTDILAGCIEVLKPGGHIVITTRPWRKQGALVDLPGEVFRRAEAIGLLAVERNVALLCALKGDGLIARPSFFQLDYVRKARAKGVPLSVIAHEDVLVLRSVGIGGAR